MSILIILRRQLIPNRFNDLLLKSIDSGEGDSAIICSGFFQENSFSASNSTGLCCVLKRNKIKTTTIGVYNKLWQPQYKDFVNNLIACGNVIQAKKTKSNKWHAKIFILKKDNNPIFGIVGSSNMTSRAFGIWKDFNFEADVVLWDTSNSKLNAICLSQSEVSNGTVDDLIFADYDNEKNGNKTAMERLIDLEKDLDIENLEDIIS